MSQILKRRNYDFADQVIILPTELQLLIDSGFRTEQECILFKDFEYIGPGELDSDCKKTDYELFLNDIHIDDYIQTEDEFEYLKFGIEFGKSIYQKLQKTFPLNFKVIISFCETAYIQNEVDVFGGCVVQFYTIRKKCLNQFKAEDLEEYETEAIMVIG